MTTIGFKRSSATDHVESLQGSPSVLRLAVTSAADRPFVGVQARGLSLAVLE